MDPVQKISAIKEVADQLRCSKTHVQHAIDGKLLGCHDWLTSARGRRKLIRSDWLEDWLEASKLQ